MLVSSRVMAHVMSTVMNGTHGPKRPMYAYVVADLYESLAHMFMPGVVSGRVYESSGWFSTCLASLEPDLIVHCGSEKLFKTTIICCLTRAAVYPFLSSS